MRQLTLHLLGQFHLALGETPLAVSSSRLRALLAYLALHDDVLADRARLAYLFWPESAESQARANLRKLWHQLRRTIPAASRYLITAPGRVGWRPGAPVISDVAQFNAALDQAVTAARAADRAAQQTALERAATLYGGDLLPACYDDWILPRREQLRQAYGEALHDLVELLAGQGAYGDAIHHARRLRRLDPLREDTTRQLMRLYSLSGDRASAVNAFRQLERRLRQELDVAPGAATRDLHARIVAADRPLRPAPRLPNQLTSFVGRERELALISRRLQGSACRLLTLVGPGGSGKTRLALQAALALADQFADGVWFVSLETVAAPDQVVTAVAAALGVAFVRADDLQTQLVDALRQKQLLLVLDNFEHLLDATDLPAALLAEAPAVRLLITSRERLKLPQEWLLEVAGLPWPADPQAEDQAPDDAVQLFRQRARQVRPQLAWTPAEKQAAIRICQALGGLPLGIELAAAWLRVLSCAEIERELGRHLDLPEAAGADLPLRHRSLRAVFRQSWDYLSAAERRLWRQLAIFQGRFDRRAAAAVAGAGPSALMALVDKSLLRQDGAGLFAIHALVRRFGRQKLGEHPVEQAATCAAHGAYFLQFLHQRQQPLLGREQRQAAAEIAAVIDDVRAAWEWAVAGRQALPLLAAADTLARFYHVRGWFSEGRDRFQRGVAGVRVWLADRADSPEAVRLLARLLIHEGLFQLRLSDFGAAADCLEESRAVSAGAGAPRTQAAALARLAEVRFREGAYAAADALCREGLALSRPLGEKDPAARALSIQGQVAFAQGRFVAARRFFADSQALTEEVGDSWALAHLHNNLGMTTHELGHYDTAWMHFQASHAIFQEMDDRWGQALVTNNMGQAALLRRRFDEAETWLQKSLALRREFGNRWAIAFVLNNLGRLQLRRGQLEQARDYATESLAIRRQFADSQGVASCLLNLGDIARAMDEPDVAEGHYLACLQTAVAIDSDSTILAALLGLAYGLARAPHDAAALALELAALATAHPATTDDKRQEAEALAAVLAERFSPAQAAAMQQHGRARPLAATAAALLDRFA